MAESETFAQRLQTLRKNRGLSQTELGTLAGLHYTHISRYERGLAKPNSGKLTKLADVFGVTTDFLMEGGSDVAARAKLADKELLQQFQEVERLPEKEKSVVKIFLDAFLTKKKIQILAA